MYNRRRLQERRRRNGPISITGAAALVRAMDIYPNQIREVRTAPSFPYEPAYPAALLRELPPPETILVTPTPRIIGSGHWDVNDILAAGTGGRARRRLTPGRGRRAKEGNAGERTRPDTHRPG